MQSGLPTQAPARPYAHMAWVGIALLVAGAAPAIFPWLHGSLFWLALPLGLGLAALSEGGGVMAPVLGLALWWWRKSGGAAFSLRELLPGPKGTRIFGVVLLCWYVFWGFAINPRSIPGILHGQLTIWLIYAGLLFVFFRCLRQSSHAPASCSQGAVVPGPPFKFSWRGFVLACAVATFVTTISRLVLFPFVLVQIGIMFTFFVVVGIIFSRIAAEFILIVFRINEHLGAIRDQGQGH